MTWTLPTIRSIVRPASVYDVPVTVEWVSIDFCHLLLLLLFLFLMFLLLLLTATTS
jgi:hypothetical protein